jgi:serine protease Do
MRTKIYAVVTVALICLTAGVSALRGRQTLRSPLQMAVRGIPLSPDVFRSDERSWLGVHLSEVTHESARELKLPGEYGAVVVAVEDNSPAAKAGLARNDVILEFNGERVWSVAQFERVVRETPPGRAVTIKIIRAGQLRTRTVELEGHESGFFSRGVPLPNMRGFDFRNFGLPPLGPGPGLGVWAEDLSPQLAEYFGVKQGKGVLVSEVMVGSAADKAGFKAGDVIVRVDGTEVGSPAELRRALSRSFEEKRQVAVTVVRDRHEQTISVALEAMDHHPLRPV